MSVPQTFPIVHFLRLGLYPANTVLMGLPCLIYVKSGVSIALLEFAELAKSTELYPAEVGCRIMALHYNKCTSNICELPF